MPYFYQDVEAEIDISVDDFLSECRPNEIKELIQALVEDGHLTADSIPSKQKFSINEQEHRDACSKIMGGYHSLSNEDCEVIKKIANKL